MNRLLNWLDQRQNRLIVLYCVFSLSAWWIMKNQIAFAYPLTKVNTITGLTIMSTLKESTVLTRWAAIYLDHGLRLPLLFSAIHTEDWVFMILGLLFCFRIKGRLIAQLIRTVLVIELGLNAGLAYTFVTAMNSTDTLAIFSSVKHFALFELFVSVILMCVLFVYLLRLIFHEYSD